MGTIRGRDLSLAFDAHKDRSYSSTRSFGEIPSRNLHAFDSKQKTTLKHICELRIETLDCSENLPQRPHSVLSTCSTRLFVEKVLVLMPS